MKKYFLEGNFEGCSGAPPVRPALEQTVINISRSSENMDSGAMSVYIDGLLINKKQQIGKGGSLSYPVNNGVHTIQVVVDKKLQSDVLNFTANSKTVSFVASITRVAGKRTLILARSETSNDTGTATNKTLQESYGKN